MLEGPPWARDVGLNIMNPHEVGMRETEPLTLNPER